MKIKVSIEIEKQEGFFIMREVEVELSEETVNEVAKQIYAAQQTLAPDAANAPRIVEVLDENGNLQKIAVP